jgi:hypothetical protein
MGDFFFKRGRRCDNVTPSLPRIDIRELIATKKCDAAKPGLCSFGRGVVDIR